jgi:hypothetical protein
MKYDGESNCIRAGENDTGCTECWWPYWFHGSRCNRSLVLKVSRIVSLIGLLVIVGPILML